VQEWGYRRVRGQIDPVAQPACGIAVILQRMVIIRRTVVDAGCVCPVRDLRRNREIGFRECLGHIGVVLPSA